MKKLFASIIGFFLIIPYSIAFFHAIWFMHSGGTTPQDVPTADGEIAINPSFDQSGVNNLLTSAGNPIFINNSPDSSRDFVKVSDYNGTDEYLSIADNSDWELDGDFTIDFWVLQDATVTNATVINYGDNASWNNGTILLDLADRISFRCGNNWLIDTTAGTIIGDWQHIAITRDSSNDVLFYLNGAETFSGSCSGTIASNLLNIGRGQGNNSYILNGKLKNIRMIKGKALDFDGKSKVPQNQEDYQTARNTLNGTTEKEVLFLKLEDNFANTSQDGANGTVTANNMTVADNLVWNKKYSIDFDGSGDYFDVPDSTAWDFGTNQFTMDFWVKLEGTGENAIFGRLGGAGFSPTFEIVGLNRLYLFASGTCTIDFDPTSDMILGKWSHIAIVREGTGTNQTKIYKDGVLEQSGTCSTNFDSSYTGEYVIGSYYTPREDFLNGGIGNLRFINGSALWTSNFTPPTADTTYTSQNNALGSNLKLWLPMRGDISKDSYVTDHNVQFLNGTKLDSDDADCAGGNEWDNVCTAGASTGYNWGYFDFDGTDDYMSVATSDDFSFGTDTFTIDFWLNPEVLLQDPSQGIINTYGGSGWFIFAYSTSGEMAYQYGGTDYDSNVLIPANEWSHWAWVREGTGTNEFKLYKNGVQVYQTTNSGSNTSSTALELGAGWNSGIPKYEGKMKNIRILKGVALDIPTMWTADELYKPLEDQAVTEL